VKISTKGLYGTLAVLDLAIHYASGHVHKVDIAQRQGIPEQYLAQLLSILRRAGYVKSLRGPAGGHMLARSPAEINVGEIIELLDGRQRTEIQTGNVHHVGKNLLVALIRQADAEASRVLGGMTFEQLVESWGRGQSSGDYVI
jgi:Rrf2 family protein